MIGVAPSLDSVGSFSPMIISSIMFICMSDSDMKFDN